VITEGVASSQSMDFLDDMLGWSAVLLLLLLDNLHKLGGRELPMVRVGVRDTAGVVRDGSSSGLSDNGIRQASLSHLGKHSLVT
jgi:hypothetical protein